MRPARAYRQPRGVVTLGEETPETRQWADVYDGRYGFTFYGHEPFTSVRKSTHATGLDTSCVFGGELTAAVLDGWTARESVTTVSVPAVRPSRTKKRAPGNTPRGSHSVRPAIIAG